MADRAPLGWPRLRGTFVEPAQAELVLAALQHYVRVNGLSLRDEDRLLIRALEVDVKERRGESPASPGPALRWLPLKLAAERAEVSVEAVRKRANAGGLVSKKIGRQRFVTEDSVDRWRRERADVADISNRLQPSPTRRSERSA